MAHFPDFQRVMQEGRDILPMKAIQKNRVYAAVDRKKISINHGDEKVITQLRDQENKLFWVWSTTKLTELMTGREARELPCWLAIPDTKYEKAFINVTAMELNEIDYKRHPWAVEVRKKEILPVYLQGMKISLDHRLKLLKRNGAESQELPRKLRKGDNSADQLWSDDSDDQGALERIQCKLQFFTAKNIFSFYLYFP